MGRVARYKKIKSFDPYSKENRGRIALDRVGVWGLGDDGRKVKKRSKTVEKLRAKRKRKLSGEKNVFDLPPVEKDEFDMNDLVGSIRKDQSPPKLEKMKAFVDVVPTPCQKPVTIPNESDDLKEARLLKIDKQIQRNATEAPIKIARLEGESRAAFNRRVMLETRQIIRDQKVKNRNPEKKILKKEFLQRKKGKKKAPSGSDSDDYDITGRQTDELPGAKRKSDSEKVEDGPVMFWEQAQRPPTFQKLPRGALKKGKDQDCSARIASRMEVASEQESMELLRRKVQAQYAAIKARRKENGDFHL